MVASAHGDLQSLLDNPNLNTLLGGTSSVTIGDKAAEENGGNKVRHFEHTIRTTLTLVVHITFVFVAGLSST